MVTSAFNTCEDYQSNLLTSRPAKRKLPDYEVMYHPDSRPKRVSPFLNTPKQRRDERRKVLRMSVAKLKAIDDPETFLCRSVLINNTVRRLNREMKEEKRFGYGVCGPAAKALRPESKSPSFSPAKRRVPCDYDVVNNSYLPYSPGVPDEPEIKAEKITDDMSDALAKTVSTLGTEAEESMSVDTAEISPSASSNISTSSSAPRVAMTTCAQEEAQTISHSNNGSDCSMLTENERQILGEMDVMFNKLINVLSEVMATC